MILFRTESENLEIVGKMNIFIFKMKFMSVPKSKLLYPVLIFFALIVSSNAIGQRSDSSFTFTLAVGPSIPLGSFGDKSIDSAAGNGWADIGFAIQGTLHYQFKKSPFGLGLVFGWQENQRNSATLKEIFNSSIPSGGHISANAGSWSVLKLLAGPTFQIPISRDKKIIFTAGLSAGVLKTSIPGWSFSAYSSSSLAESAVSSAIPLPAAFCYQVNAGLEYRIGKTILLSGSFNFSQASPTWNYTFYGFPPSPTGIQIHQAYHVSTLNILFGVTFEL